MGEVLARAELRRDAPQQLVHARPFYYHHFSTPKQRVTPSVRDMETNTEVAAGRRVLIGDLATSASPTDPMRAIRSCSSVNVTPCLRIRPLGHGEIDVVERVFHGLSANSRYQRFLTPMPRLPNAIRDNLAAADGVQHVAIVAELVSPDPRPIGLAHHIRTTDGAAEIGIEVIDEWHHQGIGRRLLQHLVCHGSVAGITRFEGIMLSDNRAVLALLRSELNATIGFHSPGLSWFSATVPAAAPCATSVA